MKWLNYLFILTLTALTWSQAMYSYAYQTQDFSKHRELFLKAESEIKQGKSKTFRQNLGLLKAYPLFPYLSYAIYKKKIGKLSIKDLEEFLTQYANSPLADKLRTAWLQEKAKQSDWQAFLTGYKYSNNVELQCNFIHAHLKINQDISVLKYVNPIWLNGNSQPKACDKVFQAWDKNNFKTRALVWQRIKLAIEENNTGLARYLSKSLKKSERGLVELWIRVYHDPLLINKSHYFTSKHPAVIEIIMHGIIKISKSEPKKAITLWKQLARKHTFTERHWGVAVREISIALARKQHPDADKWLQKIPAAYVNTQVFNEQLKLALKLNNWQRIYKIYASLPPKLAKSEKWQYWYARSLEMLGLRSKSQEILIQVAQQRSYYGFLSSVRILKPYAFKNQKMAVTEHALKSITKKPSIQRAYELHMLGRTHKGSLEWNYALKNITEQERAGCSKISYGLEIT